MEHEYDEDPELVEDEGYENTLDANLLSEDLFDEDEEDPLNEYITYWESLSQESLVDQFKTLTDALKESAKQIANAPSFKNLEALLQELDEIALRVQTIQSIYFDNFGKELY